MTIEYADIFQQELDKQMIAEATSGWMELNAGMVRYNGGNEVKIPKIVMDGMGDYDREEGFVRGAVSLTWQTHTLTQDRGRTFSIDAMDVDESNFVVTAGNVMGEFQRTKVAPEIDAYRYSKIAAMAIEKDKATSGYTPETSTILTKLRQDVAAIQDKIGEGEQLVITMPYPVAVILEGSKEIAKYLSVIEFAQGEMNFKVKAIDNIPIIKVPSARMKTEYLFKDGTTNGQEAGGFSPTQTAKDINWLITGRRAVIAVSKTDTPRIFDPMTNQQAHAWKIDYRKYHDLWILDNKLDAIRANIKQALE